MSAITQNGRALREELNDAYRAAGSEDYTWSGAEDGWGIA